MHIHILGICGTFMGGIASLAQAAGNRVTGCDSQVYPPMSTQLEQLGISLHSGWDAGQLALAPDVFVIGNVVARGNPLMEAILDAGLPYMSGPQWLAETLLRDYEVLAVAGTHGKTTTTSMLAWILDQAGLAPGFLIGGVAHDFGISARLPGARAPGSRRPPFVIEADEYDTAFFDKRSKFVHYHPRVAVLNNLEFDHADIFSDLEHIETQFHHLVRTIPGAGRLVVPHDDTALQRVLARGCWTPIDWLDASAGWSAQAGAGDDELVLFQHGRRLGAVRWRQQGEHNRRNAAAAIAAAAQLGVDPLGALQALGSFQGVRRRMEPLGQFGGIQIYDDFAHHPTAITTTLDGLRARAPQGRILAVIEPRSNTRKMGVWSQALAASLTAADRVFCLTAGLGWDPAQALAPLGARASCHGDLDSLLAAIAAAAVAGD
ncbi:MAG: UDP-N-acetylmuramate:L-alanyl-gamma-D-glutamyl-meso-diaminopimelate ligase, partial [Pseudomonadota bacterium]|nr:UDP-N-acetylmuramate:L-alanyl-gamma-D-glutamyl-meso-diaminopimelate ligase [Pseudomonadota bacterium]